MRPHERMRKTLFCTSWPSRDSPHVYDSPAAIRKPGEGRRIGIVGDVYRFLATGEETDGKYATFEAIVPPGSGPPPHIHSREEEGFYVLEREVMYSIGDAATLRWKCHQRVVTVAHLMCRRDLGNVCP